jgi:RNA ligase
MPDLSVEMLLAALPSYVDHRLVSVDTHPTDPAVVLLNYTIKCSFRRAWDPVTVRCRGLVVDWVHKRLLANPFPKFGDLPWPLPVSAEPPIVTKKIDGWLGIVWWHDNAWEVTTRGRFLTSITAWARDWLYSYVDPASLDQRYTYLVELVHPVTQVVIPYPVQGFVFLGARRTDDGDELPGVPGVPRLQGAPPSYPAGPYLLQAPAAPSNDLAKLCQEPVAGEEGYVAWWPASRTRYKIKFASYTDALQRLKRSARPGPRPNRRR